MAKKRIGILTGGGDVPGLNSVIKSVVYRGSSLSTSLESILAVSVVISLSGRRGNESTP